MTGFVSKTHILGRFPELGENTDFLIWVKTYDGNIWHETEVDEDGNLVLVLQSANRLNIFAALLHRYFNQAEDGILKHEIIETRSIDLSSEDSNGLISAVRTVKDETKIDNTDIHALRPVINFSSKNNRIIWEIESRKSKSVKTFQVREPGKLSQIKVPLKKRIKNVPVMRTPNLNVLEDFGNDWLSENECHHLTAWRPMALNITGAAASPSQKAFAIFNYVRQTMRYDATIMHIESFTWSDTLIANILNWRGICDEWSVIQITLLRCVGVPAVLKLLSWQFGGQPDAHACVEWLDGTVWRHLDALYGTFDNRSVYRQRGAVNVKVMDASFPMDARFTGVIPHWGVMDSAGDQKFYPYGDFIISPPYPGDFRQGYSY